MTGSKLSSSFASKISLKSKTMNQNTVIKHLWKALRAIYKAKSHSNTRQSFRKYNNNSAGTEELSSADLKLILFRSSDRGNEYLAQQRSVFLLFHNTYPFVRVFPEFLLSLWVRGNCQKKATAG